MNENALVHSRYNMDRELHRRLSVEAAMRGMGIQALLAEILDKNLPELDKK